MREFLISIGLVGVITLIYTVGYVSGNMEYTKSEKDIQELTKIKLKLQIKELKAQ